jgi:hypothetical protein
VPILKRWYEKYSPLGLRVVAFHRPEFDFEKSQINILKFLLKEKIEYPVVLDNLDQAWIDWKVEFWPQHFLIAPQANGEFRLVYTHYGDRNHHEMEQIIKNRLCSDKVTLSPYNHDEWKDMEVFFGKSHRRKNISSECSDGVCKVPIASVSIPDKDQESVSMEYKKGITHGTVKFVSSQWNTTKEYIQATKDQAELELDFTIEGLAGVNLSIYIVAEPPELDNYKESPKNETLLIDYGASPEHLSFIDSTDPQWPDKVSQIYQHKYPLKQLQIQFDNQPPLPPYVISTPDRYYICSTQIQSQSNTEGQIRFKLTVDKDLKIYVLYLTTEPYI